MERPAFLQRYRREILFLSILVVAALGVLVGSGISYRVGAVSNARYEKLEIMAKVLYLVENNYVRDVDEKDLIYGAINGMLATLDPHTTFLPPKTYTEMKVETQGKFSGIGIEITIKENEGLIVVAPIEDTPAYRAGLKAGDRIVAIDGEMTRDLSLADAVSKMRGKRGSKVKLLIFRAGMKEPKEFVIARDTIQIKSVKYRMLEPGYGYLRVTNFQEHTFYDMNKALDVMESKEGGLKGLVLDLRNNPGGLLDQAIKISDAFLNGGNIVITKGRNQKQIKVEKAHARGTRPDYPMIVLVNGGSASASEIVAGALQDNKRAVVLGTQTFGKGTVQTVLDLDDGSGLKLTIARYFTPNERDIQEMGIVPDIIVEPANAQPAKKKSPRYLREKDLKGHLRNIESKDSQENLEEQTEEEAPMEEIEFKEPDSKKKGKDEESSLQDDIQLKSALDHLKTWDVFKSHAMNQLKTSPPAQAANPAQQL